jgi:glutamine amidotransferase
VFIDPTACCESPLAQFLRQHAIKTRLAVAHIRQRTRGHVALANTHPFQRELWGRAWVFAHNGTVRSVTSEKLGRFAPIGTTDSEYAFCVMLEYLRAKFATRPPQRELADAIATIGSKLSKHGTFNFVLGDGETLFARCDTRLSYIVRQAPFGRATLSDQDVSIDFSQVTTPRDRVAVVATTPLTCDETWTIGEPGTLWVFRQGKCVDTRKSPVLHPPVKRKPAPCAMSGLAPANTNTAAPAIETAHVARHG